MYVNSQLCRMFGFKRMELMGKSVSMLMPSPLAEMHSQLVRRYVTTGEERLINKQLEHMVLNRSKQVSRAADVGRAIAAGSVRHELAAFVTHPPLALPQVLPTGLKVTRLSGISEDLLFLGIFTPVPVEEDVGHLWVSEGERNVLCVDGVLTDLLGFTHDDLTGQPLCTLVAEESDAALEAVLEEAKAARKRSHAAHKVPMSRRASVLDVHADAVSARDTATRAGRC